METTQRKILKVVLIVVAAFVAFVSYCALMSYLGKIIAVFILKRLMFL